MRRKGEKSTSVISAISVVKKKCCDLSLLRVALLRYLDDRPPGLPLDVFVGVSGGFAQRGNRGFGARPVLRERRLGGVGRLVEQDRDVGDDLGGGRTQESRSLQRRLAARLGRAGLGQRGANDRQRRGSELPHVGLGALDVARVLAAEVVEES